MSALDKKTNRNRPVINLTIAPDVRDTLDAMAKEDSRTRSQQVEWLVLQEAKRRKLDKQNA